MLGWIKSIKELIQIFEVNRIDIILFQSNESELNYFINERV